MRAVTRSRQRRCLEAAAGLHTGEHTGEPPLLQERPVQMSQTRHSLSRNVDLYRKAALGPSTGGAAGAGTQKRSLRPGPAYLRYPAHAGAEDLSLVPSAILKRPSVPAAESGGCGVPLLEDNTACFLILPVPSPLENPFFPTRILFSSVVKPRCSNEYPPSCMSLSALTKRGRWASRRNSFLELMLRNTFYELFTVLFQ